MRLNLNVNINISVLEVLHYMNHFLLLGLECGVRVLVAVVLQEEGGVVLLLLSVVAVVAVPDEARVVSEVHKLRRGGRIAGTCQVGYVLVRRRRPGRRGRPRRRRAHFGFSKVGSVTVLNLNYPPDGITVIVTVIVVSIVVGATVLKVLELVENVHEDRS